MFQQRLWAMLPLEGEVYGGGAMLPISQKKVQVVYHVVQCPNELQEPCCRGASTSDVPAVTLGHVVLEGKVYQGVAMLPSALWEVQELVLCGPVLKSHVAFESVVHGGGPCCQFHNGKTRAGAMLPSA